MQRFLARARSLLAHRDLTVLLGCCLLLGLAYSFIFPFMSIFGTMEVGMRPWQFSLFMTVNSVSSIILSTVLARWSDTHGTRRFMLLLGSASGVLGYIGYALVRDLAWLTVIGATAIAVSTVTFSQLFAHARESLARSKMPPQETPLYMNVFRLFYALAWTIGPALAAWVMTTYAAKGTFLVAAGVFAALWLVVFFFIPGTPHSAEHKAASRVPLRQAFRQPGIVVSFVAFALVFAATAFSMMNLPLFVLESLGGTPRDIGVIYSLAPIFELPLMFYFGLLASRGEQSGIIRLGVGLAVIYYGAVATVGVPWHIYPLQILGAATTAVITGVAITYFQNYLPGQAGTATNLYSTSQRVGSIAAFLSFAPLATRLGHRGIFVVCTVLCAVASALLLYLALRGRTSGRPDVQQVTKPA